MKDVPFILLLPSKDSATINSCVEKVSFTLPQTLYESHPSLEVKKETHEIFGFAVRDLLDVQGYGVKVIHVSGLIWLWGYRYIAFSDFSKCFLWLGRNFDVLGPNGLRIRF